MAARSHLDGSEDTRVTNAGGRPRDERLDGLEQRMSSVEQKLDGLGDKIDKLIDAFEKRFDGIDARLDGIDTRLEGIDTRLEGIDNRLDKLEILGNTALDLAKNLTDSLNSTRENMERGFKHASDENRKDFDLVHDAIRYWGRKVTGLEEREQRP